MESALVPGRRAPGEHALKEIAREEGRHFQAVLEEAMRVYLVQRDAQTPRASVMAKFRASVERHRRLGKRLAK